MVSYRKASSQPSVIYDHAVEEALCLSRGNLGSPISVKSAGLA
ncbi:hypothetical protein [Deinococcus hopiensis]|nr:hypothetical protein [Deinococcus hopiensis]